MGQTQIFVTKDKQLAQDTAKAWLVDMPNQFGGVVVDTDEIKVSDAANPFDVKWKSDSAGPWYVVLATPDTFAADPSVLED